MLELEVSFLDQVINFFVPTALAAPAQGVNGLNFGVFQRPNNPGYSQGSYGGGGGNGVRVQLTDDGDDDTDEDEDEEPEGEVLGESTSVVPVGAPATGAGGTSPVSSYGFHFASAILATRKTVVNGN